MKKIIYSLIIGTIMLLIFLCFSCIIYLRNSTFLELCSMYSYSHSPQILRYLALKQIKSRNSKDIFAEHSLRKYDQPILHTYMMHSPEGLALNKYPQNYAATTIPESTLEIGKILLKKGVPVDFMDSKKGTTLQQSVFLNQPNAVQFLLQNGAKKDIPMPEFYKECATHLPLDCAKLRDKKNCRLYKNHKPAEQLMSRKNEEYF